MFQFMTALRLGRSILKRLKNADNRDELVNSLISALGDGKIKPTEWALIGKQLGVFGEG